MNALHIPLRMSLIFLMTIILSSCAVGTSSNINVNASKILYKQDARTKLCFAFVASRKAFQAETTGLGMTNVPCTEEVRSLIK